MKRQAAYRLRMPIPRMLAVQLTAIFMLIFLVVVSVSYVLLYRNIENTLRKNYESASVSIFQQSDYNIGMLLETVDLVSRRLVLDAELYDLFSYASLSDVERVSLCASATRAFNDIINNYPYICSVAYYTTEGLSIRTSRQANLIAYGEQTLDDWFYRSQVFLRTQENGLKLTCLGGYNASDFELQPDSETNPSGYYLCAARSTRSRMATGTLVLNVSMEHLAAVFSASSKDNLWNRYILSNEGIVIASVNSEDVGQPNAHHPSIPHDQQSNVMRIHSPEGDLEAVYYRLTSLDGILVNEIPHSYITTDIDRLRTLIFILFGCSVLLAFVLFSLWIKRVMRPLRDLTDAFHRVEQGHLGLTIPARPVYNELGELVTQFNLMSRAIEQAFDRNVENQLENRSLEMRALRAQINPHFVYNTLNIIKWMAVIERKHNIADCVTTFSRFLEGTLRESSPTCPLEKEVEYLQDYVQIMNYRFGGLSMECAVDADCLDLPVMRFLLQPLAENAILHGMVERAGGVLRITAKKTDAIMQICLMDTGTGFSEDALTRLSAQLQDAEFFEGEHIGLVNVARRIKLFYGSRYGLSIANSEAGGAKVTLELPIHTEDEI